MAEEKDPIDAALDGVKSRYHKVLKTAGALAKTSKEINDELVALQATYDAAVADFVAVRDEANEAAQAAVEELARYTAEQEKALEISLNLNPPAAGGMVQV